MAVKNSTTKMIGQYQVIGKPLGSGGMATVHLVSKDKKKYAAKVLHQHLMRERKTVERFKQEFKIGEAIKGHSAFVGMIELFRHDGCWCLIMEYVPGYTMHDILRKYGKLSPQEAISVTYELAAALSDFHIKDYIHRDLKPDNFIITPTGHIKIMDYGVTRSLDTNITKTGIAIGTPLYMAPEQICAYKHTDYRCDLYSLGLILYRMITKRDAHGMSSDFEYMQLIETRTKKEPRDIKIFEDKELFDITQKCLKVKPGERFQDGKELCSALSKLANYAKAHKRTLKALIHKLENKPKKKPDPKDGSVTLVQATPKKSKKKPIINKAVETKPQAQNKLRLMVLLSAAIASAASGLAIYAMGWSDFFEVIKKLFS
ncbi:MAG: serine/threonine protein kinase [Lentisphaeraceae bacterium]|nr:serine/threonine protein kinase [Lentisphaeraceae bacterium]